MMDDATKNNPARSQWPLLIRASAYTVAMSLAAHAGLTIYNGGESAAGEFFGNLFGGPVDRHDPGVMLTYSIATFAQWTIPASIFLGQARGLARRIEIGKSLYIEEVASRRERDRLRWKKLKESGQDKSGEKGGGTGTFILGWIVGKFW